MKNKILSLVLALLMTASSASAVLADDVVAIAEEPEVVEAVVEETEANEYDKAIEFLANYGIFKGYDKDNTGAEDPIERYQMALFVARIATGWTEDKAWENGKDQWTNFTDIDVEPVNKYFGALSFAAQNKIIEGYGNGKFGPQDKINYQNALTMVVRTLGYTGLDWPWGYIQKAVELGLTKGISGVAYTEDLTRGQVAQIIYNAMFAKMKDGSNLALKNFGIEFGWEKVVITASDDNSFGAKAKDLDKKLVEFKLLNDDGSLGDDAYRALAANFDLDVDAHEDELAVGKAYYVLFNKDAGSNLVEIVAVEDLYRDTLWNLGKNEDYEIKEFFEEYTLVEKYTGDNYLNVTSSLKPEIMVWDKVDDLKVEYVKGYKMFIDWETLDILEFDLDDAGELQADATNKYGYKTKTVWHYLEYIGEYYKLDVKDGVVEGITKMDDDDLADYLATVAIKDTKKDAGFFKYVSTPANTAYASLDLYDTDLDNVYDRGLYETYGLGYFDNTTKKCDSCGKEYEFWKFNSVGTYDRAIKTVTKDILEEASYDEFVKYEAYPEATCDHNKKGAWFVEGYEPAVDEDGEYVDGYVIFNADKDTGAIKVVKVIEDVEDTDDEDNYVATGVLRSYNVGKKSITIGDDKRTMDYDELIGNGFYKMDKDTKNYAVRDVYDAYLKSLFNQFVKYVVVDGEVVDIKAIGTGTTIDSLIVVDSYKGISADGYFVVNGYSVADTDLEYSEFRLGSIDGWKKGDIYYNADKYEDDLAQGTVYKVVSYDKDEDAYFVEVISNGEGEFKVETYENKFYRVHTGEGNDYDNYFTKASFDKKRGDWDWDNESYTKMTSDDQWIFVTQYETGEFAVVTKYVGKLPEGAGIEGDFVYMDKNIYVVVNATFDGSMWDVLDRYNAGVVILAKDSFDYMDYNGTYAEDDRYILGGVEYTGRAVNVLNGDLNSTVYAFNDDAEIGYAYYTEGGILTDADADGYYSAQGIADMVNRVFSEDTYYARALNVWEYDEETEEYDYAFIGWDKNGDKVTFDKLYYKADDVKTWKTAVEAMILNDLGEIDGSRKHLDNIEGIEYRVIKIAEKTDRWGNEAGRYIDKVDDSIVGQKDAKKFIAEAEKYSTLEAFYVYNVKARKIVIYLVDGLENELRDNTTTVPGTIEFACTTGIDGVEGNDEYIVLWDGEGNRRNDSYYANAKTSAVADKNKDVQLAVTNVEYTKTLDEDGEFVNAAINSITFQFVGEYLEELEESIADGNEEHAWGDFNLHFRRASASTATAADILTKYVTGTCKKGADTFVMINNELVKVTAIEEIKYTCGCDLIKGFKLTLEADEDAVITDDARIAINMLIPAEAKDGETNKLAAIDVEYAFKVAVVDEINVLKNGEMVYCDVCEDEVLEFCNGRHKTVEDVLLANVCGSECLEKAPWNDHVAEHNWDKNHD